MLTAGFLIVLAVAVVLGLLLDMVDAGSGLAELDDSVAEWGAEHATSTAVDVLEVITHLGGTPVVIAALAAAAVVDYLQRRNAEVFAFVAAVGIGQLIINNLLKLLVDRDRPDVMQLVETSGSSFPSGHSTAAAAAGPPSPSCSAGIAAGSRKPGWRPVRSSSPSPWRRAGHCSACTGSPTSSPAWPLGWGWFLLVAIVFGGRAQRLGDPATAEPEGVSQAA